MKEKVVFLRPGRLGSDGFDGTEHAAEAVDDGNHRPETARNEEQSTIIVGELKACREALDAHYRAFITYINAVQEIQPEEQIAQSHKKKKGDVTPVDPDGDDDSQGGGGGDE